ncbi:MAG: type II toxin-antitoxin system HicB family antitoxin [Verrucomicrobiota bacterium]|nr:type II toxin-antitoxin system HicB family antitoxin [Verrucomicrobiota bacterium]
MKPKIVVHAEPEGGYWAEVPALPGCVTQGETMAELRVNPREAVAASAEVLQERAVFPDKNKQGERVLEMAL